jgi:hypothetical protein
MDRGAYHGTGTEGRREGLADRAPPFRAASYGGRVIKKLIERIRQMALDRDDPKENELEMDDEMFEKLFEYDEEAWIGSGDDPSALAAAKDRREE